MTISRKKRIYVFGTLSAVIFSVVGAAIPANAGGGYIPPITSGSVRSTDVQKLVLPTSSNTPTDTVPFADPITETVSNKAIVAWNGPTYRSPRSDISWTARRQIGYADSGIGANSSGWSKYGAWYSSSNPGLGGVNVSNGAWCAMFTSWAYAASGNQRRIQTRKGMHHVYSGFSLLRRKGQVANGKRTPYLMDLMSIRTPGGHIGLGYGMSRGRVITIEGNVYDHIDQRWRVRWNSREKKDIIAYGSPL